MTTDVRFKRYCRQTASVGSLAKFPKASGSAPMTVNRTFDITLAKSSQSRQPTWRTQEMVCRRRPGFNRCTTCQRPPRTLRVTCAVPSSWVDQPDRLGTGWHRNSPQPAGVTSTPFAAETRSRWRLASVRTSRKLPRVSGVPANAA